MPAHADRDVGEARAATAARTCRRRHGDVDAGAGRAARRGCAWRSGRGRRAAARRDAVVDVREVDAGVRAHEAVRGLADDEVAAPAHARAPTPTRRAARRRRGSSGSRGTSRPSAFDTIFCVTTRQSSIGERRALRRRRRRRRARRSRRPALTSGSPWIGMTSSGSQRGQCGEGLARERGGDTRASRISVSATTGRTPSASTAARVARVEWRRSRAWSRTRGTRGRRRRTTPRCRAGP